MEQSKIDRINELYRKSKAEGLTEAEKKEQTLLRKEFVADVKKNLTAQLTKETFVKSILPYEMPCCREKWQRKAAPL